MKISELMYIILIYSFLIVQTDAVVQMAGKEKPKKS